MENADLSAASKKRKLLDGNPQVSKAKRKSNCKGSAKKQKIETILKSEMVDALIAPSPSNHFKSLEDYADFIKREAELDADDVISFKKNPTHLYHKEASGTINEDVQSQTVQISDRKDDSKVTANAIVQRVKKLDSKTTKCPLKSNSITSPTKHSEKEKRLLNSASTSNIDVGNTFILNKSASLSEVRPSCQEWNNRRRSSRSCVLDQMSKSMDVHRGEISSDKSEVFMRELLGFQ